jgi:hypothetical protein
LALMVSPIFLESAIEAVQRRVDDQSLSLLVSIEPDDRSFDAFWSDSLVLSAVNSTFLIVRLSAGAAPDDFSQFQELYPIPSIPSLFYFAPSEENPARIWAPSFPTADEFYAFFISKLEMPAIGRHPSPARSTRAAKVSLAFGSARFTAEFPPDATVGDLRAWANLQVSGRCRFTVALSGADLTGDDAVSLTAAGFVPSVALRAEPIEQLNGESLPSLPTDIETAEIRPREAAQTVNARAVARGWLRRICGWLNPWPWTIEVEDFFVAKDE